MTTTKDEKIGFHDVEYAPEDIAEIDAMAEAAVRALNAGVLRDEAEVAARAASCAPNRGDPKQSNDQQTP